MAKEKVKSVLYILGIYQIVGGIIGVVLAFNIILFHFQLNIFFLLYYCFGAALFSFCLYAGINCFRNSSLGITLTFYNQLIQFITFTIFGFEYLYNAGFGLYFGFDITHNITFSYQFLFPKFSIGKSDPDKIILLINIIPIVFALLATQLKKDIKENSKFSLKL